MARDRINKNRSFFDTWEGIQKLRLSSALLIQGVSRAFLRRRELSRERKEAARRAREAAKKKHQPIVIKHTASSLRKAELLAEKKRQNKI